MRLLRPSLVLLVFLIALNSYPGECARILALLPTLSRSHHIFNRAFMFGLADRGHDIIAVSPDYEKNRKNLRYIQLENTYENFEANVSVVDWAGFSPKENIDSLFEECIGLCEHQFQTEGFKELLSLMNEKFDLVIMEAVVSECFYGFLPHFGVPVVAVSAYGYGVWTNEQTGVPDPMAVFPQSVLPYTTKMSFFQRIHNIVITLYTMYQRQYHYLPKMETIARRVFGEEMLPLSEIERNFSIFIANSGPGTDPARARPPSVIEVGCLHCKPGKSLPQDIQEFLDGGKDGVIFFSLGSNVRSDKMPVETLQAFLSVFSTLKQRVLWKWESDVLPGKPDNVKVGKWLPQQDILAHPNVKLFITHGGRLSTQEAVYHGVPILAVPVFFDQYMNARRAEDMGVGLRLDFVSVTKDTLTAALNHLISDSKYAETAHRQSVISRDQPETSLERAIFWTEYVLRHNGAPHLRASTLNLPWYQLYLFDVAALVVCVLGLIITLLVLACRACSTKKQETRKSDKKMR